MNNLWVVCDVSGSMLEGGKRFIARGLLHQIGQFVRLGYISDFNVRIATWGNELKVLEWSLTDEVPAEILNCRGSACGDALAQIKSESDSDRILILSDGFWSDRTRMAVRAWRSELGKTAVRAIRIGADANPKFIGPEVFEAEDFFLAIDGWF